MLFASGSWDHTMIIWDVDRMENVKLIHEHQDFIKCLETVNEFDARSGVFFSNYLISGGDDMKIKIYDVNSNFEFVKQIAIDKAY